MRRTEASTGRDAPGGPHSRATERTGGGWRSGPWPAGAGVGVVAVAVVLLAGLVPGVQQELVEAAAYVAPLVLFVGVLSVGGSVGDSAGDSRERE